MAVERIEQVRAAAYLHPKFEVHNEAIVEGDAGLTNDQIDQTLAALLKAEPKLRARAVFW